MLDHGFGLFVTTNTLNLAGGDLAHHSSYSLSNGSLKHLIELRDIHTKIVDIFVVHVDVKDHRNVDLHKNIVACGTRSHRLVKDYVLLCDQVLSLCPRKAPVHARLPDTQVLTVLGHAGDNTLWTIKIGLLGFQTRR
jgi:hypothetical protein